VSDIPEEDEEDEEERPHQHKHELTAEEDEASTSHHVAGTPKPAGPGCVLVDVIGCRFLPGEGLSGYRVMAGAGGSIRSTTVSSQNDSHPLFTQRLRTAVASGEDDVVLRVCDGSGQHIGSVRLPVRSVRTSAQVSPVSPVLLSLAFSLPSSFP
jgi:hypothetical protein